MSTDNAVISAAVGAVVATGVTLVVSQIQRAKEAKAVQADVTQAERNGYTRGYYEGRESLLQNPMPNLQPSDFTSAR